MPTGPTTLAALMAEAADASPSDRMNYRDAIAAYGAEAITAVEPWLEDRKTAALAVHVIRRAAEADGALAITVLRRNYKTATSPVTRGDIGEALDALGSRRSARSKPPRVRERSEVYVAMELNDLVRGYFYARSDLHARGLGGNPQSGISYPAGGDYALLFTHPGNEGETGYHDRWVDGNEIQFYGQWAGAGDMPFNATNRKFVD